MTMQPLDRRTEDTFTKIVYNACFKRSSVFIRARELCYLGELLKELHGVMSSIGDVKS